MTRPPYPPRMSRYALDRRLTGPQDRSGLARNIAPQPEFDTVTVQPLAGPHTDYAIPAHQDARTHTHVGFPVHTIKGQRGKRGIAPLFLNLGTRWASVVNFTPRPLFSWERTRIPTEQDAGWAPEPVLSFWRREKSPALTGIRAPDRPARTLVSSDYAAPAPVVCCQILHCNIFVTIHSSFSANKQYSSSTHLGDTVHLLCLVFHSIHPHTEVFHNHSLKTVRCDAKGLFQYLNTVSYIGI
jgi:hypothetical protein